MVLDAHRELHMSQLLLLRKVEYGGSRPQKSPKKSPKNGSLNRDLLKFLNRYGIFWVPPGESSCPDGSEYVWQRGVESLQGRVTDGRS